MWVAHPSNTQRLSRGRKRERQKKGKNHHHHQKKKKKIFFFSHLPFLAGLASSSARQQFAVLSRSSRRWSSTRKFSADSGHNQLTSHSISAENFETETAFAETPKKQL
jgi:hypothetical protein